MSRSYILRKGYSTLSDLADGNLAGTVANQGAKTIFYVEGNSGNDSEDGLSWATAFKTLTVGLAASHADIGSNNRGWASRNVIYVKGDALDEDLVLLAQKTDVVGVGHWDQFPYTGLIGNHIPVGTTTTAYGTRFFNFMFRANSAGGDIWTLNSTVSGLHFYNCYFDANSTTAATGAIVATASPFLGVYDCKFTGKYSDAVIEFGAGDARGAEVIGNRIEGVDEGIGISASTTNTDGGAEKLIIKDNMINTTAICINDGADVFYITDNRCVTLNAKGSGGAGAIVGEENFSTGNMISASDLPQAWWPALTSL